MKKSFIAGIIFFLLGLILMFLSGSSSGPDMKPTVPFLYGTNQFIYLLMAVIGLVFIVIGIIMGIVRLIKKPKQQ